MMLMAFLISFIFFLIQIFPIFAYNLLNGFRKKIFIGGMLLYFGSNGLFTNLSFLFYTHEYGLSYPILLNIFFLSGCILLENILLSIVLLIGISQFHQNNEVKIYDPNCNINNGFIFGFLALVFFLLWCYVTEGKSLYHPRLAYQTMRDGNGFIWALMIVFSSWWFIGRISKGKNYIISLVIYFIVLVCSGSKLLTLGIVFFIIFNPWKPFKISILHFATISIALVSTLFLFGQFGSTENFFYRFYSYVDNFKYSSRVFTDYAENNFDFFHGQIFFTEYWKYIPRMIYPEKPYVWGSTVLLESYYPGLASTGATPSFGSRTKYFADFGFAGIFMSIIDMFYLFKLLTFYIIVSWKHSNSLKVFSIGFLLLPGFSFHFPQEFSLIMFIILSRISILSLLNYRSVNG